MYFHGRDRNFRPLLIMRPRKILEVPHITPEEGLGCIMFIIEYMIDNLFESGQFENCQTIFDLENSGATEIDRKNVMFIMKNMQKNYKCLGWATYILNTCLAIRILWKILSPFVIEITKRKMIFNAGG